MKAFETDKKINQCEAVELVVLRGKESALHRRE